MIKVRCVTDHLFVLRHGPVRHGSLFVLRHGSQLSALWVIVSCIHVAPLVPDDQKDPNR